MPALPEDFLARWADVERALPAGWRSPATAASPVTPRVWKVTLAGGRALAIKLAVLAAPVDRETQVLRFLKRRGCPVPAVAAAAAGPNGWLCTVWCGDVTMDDWLQPRAGPQPLDAAGNALGGAVLDVEEALLAVTPVSPAVATREALREHGAAWMRSHGAALRWLFDGAAPARAEEALAEVSTRAFTGVPAPGSLDYNARNVVLDAHSAPPRVTLVDFAATGFDWSERRLVQYGLAAGSREPRGTFASVITPAVVWSFAERAARTRRDSPAHVAEQVDAHDVLLLLTAAAQLALVEAGRAEGDRARSWSNVAERKERLLALLRRPLAGAGPAERLRACLR